MVPAGDDSAQAVQAQELLPVDRPAPGDQLLFQDGQDAEPAAEGEPGLEEDPEQRPPADRLRRPVVAGGRLVVGEPAVAVGGLAIAVGGHGQGFGGRPGMRATAPWPYAAPWGCLRGRTRYGRIMSWCRCSSSWLCMSRLAKPSEPWG
jgi:hypothetical protein